MHCYRCSTSTKWIKQGGNIYRCPNCGFIRSGKDKPHHQEPVKFLESEMKDKANRKRRKY